MEKSGDKRFDDMMNHLARKRKKIDRPNTQMYYDISTPTLNMKLGT